MAQRAQVTLVPGATESECLRASRRMPDPQDRDAFAHIVRVWQYAAYARRLPDEAEFDAMLGTLAQRFGWARCRPPGATSFWWRSACWAWPWRRPRGCATQHKSRPT